MSRTWMGLVVVFGVAGGVNAALAQPAEVVIIRHAEKPAEGNELSQQGRERAAALAPYFLETAELLEFKPPVAIYAPLPNKEGSSIRSAQTVAPLATMLHLTISEPFHKDQTTQLAQEILNNRRYDGRMVLICWDHKLIPEIAKAFGIQNAPEKWKGEVYDRCWVIKFPAGGNPTFQNLLQRLMFGDSPK